MVKLINLYGKVPEGLTYRGYRHRRHVGGRGIDPDRAAEERAEALCAGAPPGSRYFLAERSILEGSGEKGRAPFFWITKVHFYS